MEACTALRNPEGEEGRPCYHGKESFFFSEFYSH